MATSCNLSSVSPRQNSALSLKNYSPCGTMNGSTRQLMKQTLTLSLQIHLGGSMLSYRSPLQLRHYFGVNVTVRSNHLNLQICTGILNNGGKKLNFNI